MKRSLWRCLSLVGLTVAAASTVQAASPPATMPLRYGSPCAAKPGEPNHITLREAPKGLTVTFERSDLGPLDSRDVNLAFVSRRLFFKLRTATELIEFQGRAEDGELEGMLSDEHGTRHVLFPREPDDRSARCGTKP